MIEQLFGMMLVLRQAFRYINPYYVIRQDGHLYFDWFASHTWQILLILDSKDVRCVELIKVNMLKIMMVLAAEIYYVLLNFLARESS